MKIGAIEAGGTKFVCAISDKNLNIEKRATFKTESPETTMGKVIDFFKGEGITHLGIGSFGPIDPNPRSSTFGYITKTPKEKWIDYNIVGVLKESLNIDNVHFDTDVNCAALGEAKFGIAKGLTDVVYLTIGTGIGGGAIVDGKTIKGLLHPEMGHIFVRRHKDDTFEGTCVYHKDCFEGLASGPAIEKRWGKPGAELQNIDAVWEMEAHYISQALINYILVLSPQKVILGGGVMQQKQIFDLVRTNVLEGLNGFIFKDEIIRNIEEYIVYPMLGQDAGLIGTIAMVLVNENIL